MSWMEQLIATYDANARFAGKTAVLGMRSPLLPIGHTVQNAQIEITIDGAGRLMHADVIATKEEQPTIIPCTPDSASRTSSPMPHPLHDNLAYIARDYERYAKKPSKDKSPYELYCEQLARWAERADAPAKVRAVYHYVTHNDIIDDLCTAHGGYAPVLYRGSDGQILEKWTDTSSAKPLIFTVAVGEMLKQFVRFRVDNGDGVPNLWDDTALQQAYIEFARSEFAEGGEQLCYATGSLAIPTTKHSKALRFAGDGAKLISSNDSSGYTYRGRFAEAGEVVTIGYDASQKAMNALKWLIRNQGYIEDERVFLAWSSNTDAPLPPIIRGGDTYSLTRRQKRQRLQQGRARVPRTQKGWADELAKALAGYRHDFTKKAAIKVSIMVLDAATPGRLSICYYDELSGAQFIAAIERWHREGRWWQHVWSEELGKSIGYDGIPAPRKIIEACYGENVSDSRKKLELEKLFYCITQGRKPPTSFARAAYSRAVKKAASLERYKWRQEILEPACCLIAKNLNSPKEEYSVALDENNRNRSYLYGRMVAVADHLERSTYSSDERGSRVTNAMKYMEVMAAKPAATWQNIQKRLLPYQQKLEKYGGRERRLIHEIGSLFATDDFLSNKPLDGRFLLGYYCQAYAIEQELAARREAKQADIAQELEEE